MNFFTELKRRHIYRVAAAYAVVAWVLIQLVSNVSPMLRLPDWAGTLVLVLLAVGFPVALLFAWIHQLAPERGTLAPVTTGKLDWALVGALVVVIALLSYQQLAPSFSAGTARQTGVAAARSASLNPATVISLAVLPFANMSGDAAQEFFSDGMSEEITTALAKIPDLRVVARESAFQFKGEKKDMRAVGQALGATHLIAGSVRKIGDRVRITAQLVQADNGLNVWTDSYDREMTDVFAIQEDIATAIAGALRMPLGLKQGERLVSNRGIDPESYQQYLRAKALVRSRGIKPLTDAIALLEQVVVRDPEYAPAWALLAFAYAVTPGNHPALANGYVEELRRVADTSLPKGEAAARRAIQLDAGLADGYVPLGFVEQRRGKFLLAESLYAKALALDPNNPEALHQYGGLRAEMGQVKDGLAMMQQLYALDPLVPAFSTETARLLWLSGQNDTAIAMLKELPQQRAPYLARVYASVNRYSDAADALLAMPSGTYRPETVNEAARLLRAAPAKAASPQSLPRLGNMEFVYLHIGASNRVLEFYEGNVEAGFLNADTYFLWHPLYAPVRKTERFVAFVRKAGFIDYWRAKGWPEFCHPTISDDFVCN